jgi:hypothetical protein
MEYTMQNKVIEEKSNIKRSRGIHKERCGLTSKGYQISCDSMENFPFDYLYTRLDISIDKKEWNKFH